MKFQLVKIDTCFSMICVLCKEIEMLSIIIKMTKLQVNKNIFYFELSIKPNVVIDGITVSMWKNMSFK